MAHYNHRFGEAFVGGEEQITPITHLRREEAREPSTPLDLTGYAIGAEVWWEGCRKLSPTVVIGNLASGEPHYTVTLTEQQTMQVPLGRVAFVKLIRMSPDGVTTIRAPIWLERKA
jgi:hypothetical protein